MALAVCWGVLMMSRYFARRQRKLLTPGTRPPRVSLIKALCPWCSPAARFLPLPPPFSVGLGEINRFACRLFTALRFAVERKPPSPELFCGRGGWQSENGLLEKLGWSWEIQTFVFWWWWWLRLRKIAWRWMVNGCLVSSSMREIKKALQKRSLKRCHTFAWVVVRTVMGLWWWWWGKRITMRDRGGRSEA